MNATLEKTKRKIRSEKKKLKGINPHTTASFIQK
jgi:hypothetical protein